MKILLVIILTILFGCQREKNVNKPTVKKDIDTLLTSNDRDLLFLRFYNGLSKDDYNQLSDYLIQKEKLYKKSDTIFYRFKFKHYEHEAYLKPLFENDKLVMLSLFVNDLCFCLRNEPKESPDFDLKPITDQEIIKRFLSLYNDKYGSTIYSKIYPYNGDTIFEYFNWYDENKAIRFKIGSTPIGKEGTQWIKELGKPIEFKGEIIGTKYTSLEIQYSTTVYLKQLELDEKNLPKIQKQQEMRHDKNLQNKYEETIKSI